MIGRTNQEEHNPYPHEMRRTCGCTGNLGAVGSEFKLYSSVPVILGVLPSNKTLMNKRELKSNGWTAFTGQPGSSLLDVAKGMGQPVPPRPDRPLVRVLKPLERNEAEPGSLSAIRGRGAFSFHTDCAYFRKPPSLILFRAVRPSNVATILLDGLLVVQSFESVARDAIFKVRGLRKYFLCNLLSGNRLRWDQECMVPADRAAHEASSKLTEMSTRLRPEQFVWSDTEAILVVDNCRMLHGRENAESDAARTLESVLVYSNTKGAI